MYSPSVKLPKSAKYKVNNKTNIPKTLHAHQKIIKCSNSPLVQSPLCMHCISDFKINIKKINIHNIRKLIVIYLRD